MHKDTVAILSWNVSHNALGRAYMLAEVLSVDYNVRLIGFLFEEHGSSVWGPVKNGAIQVECFPGGYYPEFAARVESIAADLTVDLIIVCKPRMPSLHLGLLVKAMHHKPMLLDIDDYEPSFFNAQRAYSGNDLVTPYSKVWTGFAELFIPYADQVLVASTALQEKYGGTIIPHARDELLFRPELYDRDKRRGELGIALTDKVVLFLGTPRKHKGLFELMDAIVQCNNASYKLCVIGSFPDAGIKEKLQELGGEQLLLYPDQPFEEIPKNLVIADAVCLLQDVQSDVSKYQLPAKAIDAIAMGIPVLAFPAPPLKGLIAEDLVMPTSPESLARDLNKVLTAANSFKEKQLEKRPLFLQEYSYGAIREKMHGIINDLPTNPIPPPRSVFSNINAQIQLLVDINKQLEKEHERNQSQRVKIKQLQEQRKSLQGQRKSLQDQRIDLQGKLKVLKRDLGLAEQRLRAIQQSRTWRYTWPLRKMADLCKRAMR